MIQDYFLSQPKKKDTSKGADFAEAARRETEKLRDLINLHIQKGAKT